MQINFLVTVPHCEVITSDNQQDSAMQKIGTEVTETLRDQDGTELVSEWGSRTEEKVVKFT
jgi:hypothetical protein